MSAGTNPSRSNSRSGTATSRRVISRNGRLQSELSSCVIEDYEAGIDHVTDLEEQPIPSSADLTDYGETDIFSDDGWDTDLDERQGSEEQKIPLNPLASVYLDSCKANGVIPASYFLRHLSDSNLTMNHHGLGHSGIKPIALALANSTNVIELSLVDNWLGIEGGRHVADMLKENCYITQINLSENRLSETFAQQLVDIASSNNTLTHVNLSGNEFDDKAAKFLAQAIIATTRIECLNLAKNHLGEKAGVELGLAVAENSSLRAIDLSWNCIRRKGAIGFSQGLKQNILLKVVDLSWNGFAKEGAKSLADALKVNSSIKQLDITNNRLTTEAAVLFSKGLVVNETLSVLRMGKNPMGSAGCHGVVAAIMRNPSSAIQELDFSDISVDKDFTALREKLRTQFPELRVRHGGESIPLKRRVEVPPPVVRLGNYIERNHIDMRELFGLADHPERKVAVSKTEFVDGIKKIGIRISDEDLEIAMNELDHNGLGQIKYNQLLRSRAEHQTTSSKLSFAMKKTQQS